MSFLDDQINNGDMWDQSYDDVWEHESPVGGYYVGSRSYVNYTPRKRPSKKERRKYAIRCSKQATRSLLDDLASDEG